jgi:asparagine synthase (glutamine-hydrolysing)
MLSPKEAWAVCGIFAIFNPSGVPVDLPRCRLATKMLEHRGPDACGEWISPKRDVFLGHRRLSIIDLSEQANQPMIGDTGKVLVFNGEIYNFRSLRNDLESRGIRFKTTGDTEVLLKGLEVWGPQFLTKLEGMWAIVLWSPDDNQALIARDQFGIKPLYSWRSPDGLLAISSEIKSFYALNQFRAELNRDAIPEYLRFRTLCGEKTLLRGVTHVKPGTMMLHEPLKRHSQCVTYWDPCQALLKLRRVPSKENNDEDFLEELKAIIERQLIADVPVGTQFSGGLDSSLISAIVAKDLGVQLEAFHCEVEQSAFNETPYAREIANLLGMKLHTVVLSCENFFSPLLDKLTWHNDEPLGHANEVGVYLVSLLAQSRVKVLLSGEAADEIFAGYSRHRALRLLACLRRPALRKLMRLAPGLWPYRFGHVKKFIDLLTHCPNGSFEELIITTSESVDRSWLEQMLDSSYSEANSIKERLLLLDWNNPFDTLDFGQLLDIMIYLPTLLARQDKMSMAASIENRVPYATEPIFTRAFRLPSFRRATAMGQKYFLKECLLRYLPRKYVQRKKWGFGIPLGQWFTQKAGRERLRSLLDQNSPLIGIVDMKYLRSLISPFRGSGVNAVGLWTLLALAIWMRIFLNGRVMSYAPDLEEALHPPHTGKSLEVISR